MVARDTAGNVSPASSSVNVTTQAAASNGTLNGTVSSSKGGILAKAAVTIKYSGTNHTASTDSSGNYSFSNIPPGTYTVKYSDQGYNSLSVSLSITAGNTTTKNVTLVSRK